MPFSTIGPCFGRLIVHVSGHREETASIPAKGKLDPFGDSVGCHENEQMSKQSQTG